MSTRKTAAAAAAAVTKTPSAQGLVSAPALPQGLVLIDQVIVRASERSGVYLEGEVQGRRVYMPLALPTTRRLATDLLAAADAVEDLRASG